MFLEELKNREVRKIKLLIENKSTINLQNAQSVMKKTDALRRDYISWKIIVEIHLIFMLTKSLKMVRLDDLKKLIEMKEVLKHELGCVLSFVILV